MKKGTEIGGPNNFLWGLLKYFGIGRKTITYGKVVVFQISLAYEVKNKHLPVLKMKTAKVNAFLQSIQNKINFLRYQKFNNALGHLKIAIPI